MISKTCILDNCDRPHYFRNGYCLGHGKRLRKKGDVMADIPLRHQPQHGLSQTVEFDTWRHMLQRCYNKKSKFYSYYGGRGIEVCPEWRNDFVAFYNHVGKRPEGTSIDRINNDGNYEPGNVRWATRYQQQTNIRMKKNNKSGHTGVSWYKREQRWIAEVIRDGKLIYRKNFRDLDEAVAGRSAALDEYARAKQS